MFTKEAPRYQPSEVFENLNSEHPKKQEIQKTLNVEQRRLFELVELLRKARSLKVEFDYDFYLRYPDRITSRQRAYLYAVINKKSSVRFPTRYRRG